MLSFITAAWRRKTFLSNSKQAARTRKVLLNSCMPGIEVLEARQLLSVSATTLVGSGLLTGTTSSSELLENGTTVIETSSNTVIGRTTFNGTSAIETDEMGTQSGGTITTTEKNYSDVTSAGFVGYGGTSVVNEGGSITDESTTYSPAEVELPPTMVAGTPYVENTTATEIQSGASSGMIVNQVSTTLTLESATQSITVPAGTYTAFVVDESITTTSTDTPTGGSPITTGPTTNSGKEYFAPTVGFVELAIGMGETELTAFHAGSGGGGGGGGGTGVTPVITGDTVPTAVVGGAKLHAALKVGITNPGTATEDGFTAKVYASTSATLDTSTDPLVTTAISHTKVKGGKGTSLSIPIPALPPGLPDGKYYLFVETDDSAGNTANVATTSTVTVAAPFVALSETLTTTLPATLVSGTLISPAIAESHPMPPVPMVVRNGSVTLSITNNGNVLSKGPTGLDITASTVSGTVGTTIIDIPKTLKIAPGKTAKVTVPIKTFPVLAANQYFIVAQVTDPFAAGTSIVSSTGTINVVAPFIALSATLADVTKVDSGDTLTITNNGNIEDETTLMAILGFSLDDAGANPIGSTTSVTTAKLQIKAGTSVKVKLTGWKSILTGLSTGVPYFLTASITDETGNTASAVSTTSFTLS